MAVIILNIPTLCLMGSFSFFIYYIAKLCQLVEKERLMLDGSQADNEYPSEGMRA